MTRESERKRLVELINGFYMVGKPVFIITEKGKIVERVVRTLKYLDDLGIEFECTIWEKDRLEISHLKTNIIHSDEIGKTVFTSRENAEKALEGKEDEGK